MEKWLNANAVGISTLYQNPTSSMTWASPVVECVESFWYTLDSPLAILVWIEHKLEWYIQFKFFFQGEEMFFPRASTLRQQNYLSTGIHLSINNCFKNNHYLQHYSSLHVY